jgi:hypothetical protein
MPIKPKRTPVVVRHAIVDHLTTLQPPQRIWLYLGRLAAAAVTAVSALTVAAHSSGPVGHMVVVVFVLVTPAFAISGLLPGLNGVVVLIVAAAGAAVINALVAQLMLSANAWSPPAGVIAVGLIAAFLWLVPSGGPGRPMTTGNRS